MPRMSKKRREELAFFLNDRNRVTYNELCRKCRHSCKQSFRVQLIECPQYLSKRAALPGMTGFPISAENWKPAESEIRQFHTGSFRFCRAGVQRAQPFVGVKGQRSLAG